MDQRELAELSSLSVPTIQRMEASEAMIRGNVDSLMKLVAALDAAGVELMSEGAASPSGGPGVRLKSELPSRGNHHEDKLVTAAGARGVRARQ
jgi:transcriptional regulator with XRE-family HTH domain